MLKLIKFCQSYLRLKTNDNILKISSKVIKLSEAFKNKNDETYGIFHMLVAPPPPTNGKFSVIFLLSKNDF